MCLMSLDHCGIHRWSCEKTDSITPSYPADLAVKSLPLCIFEHCWSSQIIKKTNEWEGGLIPPPLPPLATSAISDPFPRFVASSAGTHTLLCCTTGNGKTGQGAHQVVYNVGQHYEMCSLEMKPWCVSWWALTCKDVRNAVLIMPLENEVPIVDRKGIPRPTHQNHSAFMGNTQKDDLDVL